MVCDVPWEFEVSVSWSGQFRPLTSPILPVTTVRNTIFNSEKYILQLGQIPFSIATNSREVEVSVSVSSQF